MVLQVPARVALGVTTLLAMSTTQVHTISTSSPPPPHHSSPPPPQPSIAFISPPPTPYCRPASRTPCRPWPTPRPSTSGPASASSLCSAPCWSTHSSTTPPGGALNLCCRRKPLKCVSFNFQVGRSEKREAEGAKEARARAASFQCGPIRGWTSHYVNGKLTSTLVMKACFSQSDFLIN